MFTGGHQLYRQIAVEEIKRLRQERANIEALRSESIEFQRQGLFIKALITLERVLLRNREVFGTDSAEVWNACADLAALLNTMAIQRLEEDAFGEAFEMLKKAEILCEPRGTHQSSHQRLKLQAVTFNNLAYFYRKSATPYCRSSYLFQAGSTALCCLLLRESSSN